MAHLGLVILNLALQVERDSGPALMGFQNSLEFGGIWDTNKRYTQKYLLTKLGLYITKYIHCKYQVIQSAFCFGWISDLIGNVK